LLTGIIAFVLVFSGIILSHELGHFITAKLAGVRVDEFGLGYPPRIWAFKHGATVFSINWLPFGGFVKLAGEEDPSVTDSLASKSHLSRILVLASGAIVNAILPFILFSVAFMVPHDVAVGQVEVQEVAANSPAQAAGIEEGDIILSVEGREVKNITDLSRYIELNLGKNTDLLIEKSNGEQRVLTLVPRWRPPEGEGATGISIQLINGSIVKESQPLFRAIASGVSQTFETMGLFKNAILSLFVGTSSVQVTGPVGIAQLTGEAAQAGISPLLEFAAFLSLNLAIMNLLPLPALDGGRIAFVALEWMRRGRRISPQAEGMVHMIGFMLLIGFSIVITFQDIARIIGGA
jgi:regulator of sigma E protease